MYNIQTNKNPKDLKDVQLRVITSFIVAVTEIQKLFVSLVVRHIYNNIFIYIEAYYYYDIHYYTRCTDSASDVYIIYITHTHWHTQT